MTTFFIIVGIILVIALLHIFSKSAAREANRITREADLRLDGLNSELQAVDHLIHDNDSDALKAERKAWRFRARANEVASKQSPLWKVATRRTKRK